MGYRNSKINMSHAFTTDATQSHLNATTIADSALVLDSLVFSTGALPVAGRTENTFTKETTLFRFKGPVVDGLRIEDLTLGPATDGFRICDGDGDLIERVWLLVDSVKFAKIGFNTHNRLLVVVRGLC
jgi:hypothetical protein